MTSTPFDPSGSNDYYKPDQLRSEYERKNPGKSFENFMNQTEKKYGKGSVDAVRKDLIPKAPAKPTTKASVAKKPAPTKASVAKKPAPTKASVAKKPAPGKPAPSTGGPPKKSIVPPAKKGGKIGIGKYERDQFNRG